jgi:capsule polysaccharide export protein KpsE/RkpR
MDIPIPNPETGQFIGSKEAEQDDGRESGGRERFVATARRLWENRQFLGRVTSAGLLLSVGISLLVPNRYKSEGRLMPPDNQSGSALAAAASLAGGGGMGGLAGLTSDLMGQKSNSELAVGVLGSHTVEDKVIQGFNLRQVYHDRRIEDARKDLEQRTDISSDRKSQIITIVVTDKEPQRATAMVQAYIDELNRTLASVSTSAGRRERIFLEGRLKTVNQDLEAAEKQFSQFSSKNGTIDIKEQGKAMVGAAASLEGELINARSELESLRQIYTDSNVRVRSAQARVNELQNELQRVGGSEDGNTSDNSALNDSLYPSIRKLPLLGVPYADLYRKTSVQEALFEMLTQKYELAKVQEAKELPVVKVLDLPRVPEKKSFPPRTVLTLLGTVLAFACGITWMLGRNAWEQADPDDPGKVLARDVFDTVKTAIPWRSRNGHRIEIERRRTAVSGEDPGIGNRRGK